MSTRHWRVTFVVVVTLSLALRRGRMRLESDSALVDAYDWTA